MHVNRLNELMILPKGQRLGVGQRHLEFACQFVHSHKLESAQYGVMNINQ